MLRVLRVLRVLGRWVVEVGVVVVVRHWARRDIEMIWLGVVEARRRFRERIASAESGMNCLLPTWATLHKVRSNMLGVDMARL